MKGSIIILFTLTIILFCQCSTFEVNRIEKIVKRSSDVKFFDQTFFEKSRRLMFNTFPRDINKNDTIIILEYFTSFPSGFYSCTIYESESKNTRQYRIAKSIKEGKIHIDSLTTTDLEDGILPMVLNNQLDEIKKRGDSSGWTLSITLIINILTKDKEKNKYNIQTIRTKEFSTHKEMPQELWEETRKAKPYIKSD